MSLLKVIDLHLLEHILVPFTGTRNALINQFQADVESGFFIFCRNSRHRSQCRSFSKSELRYKCIMHAGEVQVYYYKRDGFGSLTCFGKVNRKFERHCKMATVLQIIWQNIGRQSPAHHMCYRPGHPNGKGPGRTHSQAAAIATTHHLPNYHPSCSIELLTYQSYP